MVKFRVNLILALSGLLLGLAATSAQAALSLSVSPIQGGTSLRFSRSDVLSKIGQEVRLRIDSTDAVQYQVYQRWVQPLTATNGLEAGAGAVRFYGISGSNGSGTLYGQMPEFLTFSDQLVYSSASNGLGDSFGLVYQVDSERLAGSGQYYGRLLFTVRPIGSGQLQEIYVDVFVDADLGFELSVAGQRGGQRIELGTRYPDEDMDRIEVAFSGNAGVLRVYQDIFEPIVHMETNADFPLNGVLMRTEGGPGDVKIPEAQPLFIGRTRLYESTQLEDKWSAVYTLNPDVVGTLSAGTYQGRIRYVVETSQGSRDYDFFLQVAVAPVFTLDLQFPEGGIHFSHLIPGSPPQTQWVDARVRSNLGRPYIVWQRSMGGLRNENNETLAQDKFSIKVVPYETTNGRDQFEEFSPIPEGETPIFISDPKGSPSEFRVEYRVEPYADMTPGSYRTEITFTLSES